MGHDETKTIERAAAEVLEAANRWRGERWYEPADLELTLRFGGPERPTVAGWQARLGPLEVSGSATAAHALEMLRDVFVSAAARDNARR